MQLVVPALCRLYNGRQCMHVSTSSRASADIFHMKGVSKVGRCSNSGFSKSFPPGYHRSVFQVTRSIVFQTAPAPIERTSTGIRIEQWRPFTHQPRASGT